jgi:hypothetical protein
MQLENTLSLEYQRRQRGDDGSFEMENFGSGGEAFGYGVGYMNEFNGWGNGDGWAGSFGEALGRFNGGQITADMVQGYYEQQWGGGDGRSNIAASDAGGVHAGQGFNVSWGTDGVAPGFGSTLSTVEIGSMFLSNAQAMNLLSGEGKMGEGMSGSGLYSFGGIESGNFLSSFAVTGPTDGGKTLDKIIKGSGLGTDINSTTWTAMSKIAGAGKTLGKIAEKGTMAGIVISVVSAGRNIMSGNGTWRDGVTLGVAGLTSLAMATGVGEVAIGVAAVAWDIWDTVIGD